MADWFITLNEFFAKFTIVYYKKCEVKHVYKIPSKVKFPFIDPDLSSASW